MIISLDSRKRLSCILWNILTFGIVLATYYFHSPYLGFFIPVVLGVNTLIILMKRELPVSFIIALSPAVGLAFLSISFYIASHLGVGISLASLIYTITTLLSSPFICFIKRKILLDRKDVFALTVTSIAIVAVHFFAYTYPTDNVDNYFHATKTFYTLKYNSMFPQTVPNLNLLTYPGGYHSLIAYLVMTANSRIPDVMLAVRVLSWLLFVFGIYLLVYSWFDKRTAVYSILVIISTNVIYYYLLVYIQPNFIGFYFFTVLLALSYIHLNRLPERNSVKCYPALGALIGASSLLFHPYSFQNFWLVLVFYILLSRGKILIRDIRHIAEVFLVYGLAPLILYVLLNPYFWFPNLAHVTVEFKYPWSLYKGVTTKNLAIFKGRAPHDTWDFFELMWNWATIRNSNYVGLLFMILGPLYYVLKTKKKAEITSITGFVLFVFFLNVDRLTVNVPIPFYSTAAMEREFLWLVPIFPILIGTGIRAAAGILWERKSISLRFLYVLLLALFFLLPTYGNARDLVSAEANFYVTPDVLEDFSWIAKHYPSARVLGSCYSDSSIWLPFFEGGSYSLLTDPYFRKCHVGNKTVGKFVHSLLSKNETLNKTIAYIDTNALSLNPLDFLGKYRLLRINKDNWIYDLSSRNTSANLAIVKGELRLCSNVIPGDIHHYGKYYVWGFTKKHLYVEYYAFGGVYFAWLNWKTGIVAFNPCKSYRSVEITAIVSEQMYVNVSVNGKQYLKEYPLEPGLQRIIVNAPVRENVLNTITITKDSGGLMILSIKFE